MPGSRIPRRTIPELIAKYYLEDSLNDIYVEGVSDASVIHWFLQAHGRRNFAVYPIEVIDVPGEFDTDDPIDGGNRSRVVALSHHLSNALNPKPPRVFFIIDRDAQAFTKDVEESEILWMTDYCCLEMYLYDRESIEKFLGLIARRSDVDVSVLLERMGSILEKIFFIRTANKVLNWRLAMIDFRRCCKIAGGNVTFSSSEFIKRYLQPKGKYSQVDQFMLTLRDLEGRRESDPRMQINGHDFIELLTLRIKPYLGGAALHSPDVIGRTLFACLEKTRLLNEPLFQRLLGAIDK